MADCGSSISQRAISPAFTQSLYKGLAFPKRGIEAGVAQGGATLDAGKSDLALNRRKLEGQRRHGSRHSLQGLGLETFHIELDERRTAVSRHQRVERRDAISADPVQRCVSQPGASRAASTKAEEKDETVGLSALIIMRALPGSRPTATSSIATERLKPYNSLQNPGHRVLRFNRDDPRAKPAKRGDAIADMGADVEYQVTWPDELAIEPIHCRGPRPVAVVDAQGRGRWHARS